MVSNHSLQLFRLTLIHLSYRTILVGTAGVEPTLPRYQHGVLTIRRHSNILALSRLTLGLALHSLTHSVITPKNQVLVDESRSAIISLPRPWDDNVRTAGLGFTRYSFNLNLLSRNVFS